MSIKPHGNGFMVDMKRCGPDGITRRFRKVVPTRLEATTLEAKAIAALVQGMTLDDQQEEVKDDGSPRTLRELADRTFDIHHEPRQFPRLTSVSDIH